MFLRSTVVSRQNTLFWQTYSSREKVEDILIIEEMTENNYPTVYSGIYRSNLEEIFIKSEKVEEWHLRKF